ncbi:hypothetical protein Ndes2437B_g08300 [Nannochloris sp. 'desiccata']
MSGRVSRQRAPVDYNNKESMVPAWLKGIQSTKSQTPPKKASKKVVSSPGSAEKENGAVDKKAAPKPKPSKSSKGSEKEKVVVAGEKKSKQKKPSTIGEKADAQPARGRNAGLTVVPIEDRKSKAPQVSGLRKPETSKPAAVPKPPAAAKEVPGLPGVVQNPGKPSTAATKATTGRPISAKRKTPAADFTPVKQIVSGTLAPGAGFENNTFSPEQSAKRSKTAVTALHACCSHAEKMLEESRRNFVELQTLFNELQEENTALKTASIRDQVEELFAQHTERVLEHGEKASDLAAHWREEAEKMASLLAESRVEEVGVQNRTLRAELATARQALLDMEAHAMCPEGAAGSSLYRGYYPGMQHENMMQNQQQYNHQQQQQPGGFGVDAPYSLRNQRTVPYLSSSDMNLASNGVVAVGGGGVGQQHQQQHQQQVQVQVQQHMTEESVQANARDTIRGRRVSGLPPVAGPLHARPGQTAADVSRQIQFYSNSLSAVPEEAAEAEGSGPLPQQQQQQQQQQPGSANAPSTGVLLSRGQGLMMAAHMDAKPLKGGKFQFTHHLTGYCFILGNDPDPSDPTMPELDIHYQPISLGTAEAALRKVCGAQPDLLLEEGWFSEEQAEMFFGFVCQAMGICAMEHK